ncbi:hypothetical protein N9242_07785 [Vicingaceae bacterium]|nr:hypothetical protein [Vicingaceae bacterium]
MTDQEEKDVSATNQDFKKFDQVTKEQTYRLASNEDHDTFDDEYEIEVCDLSEYVLGNEDARHRFSQSLGRAFEDIGFAILTNHGVDPGLFDSSNEKIIEFFEQATTVDQRMKYVAARHGSVKQGYFPIKETSEIHPDLVEGWVFCRRAFNFDGDPEFCEHDIFWPAAGFEPFFRNVCIEYQKIVLPTMQSILQYLNCDPHLYDEKLTNSNFGLRFNYYPPISDEDDATGAGRILGHEDVDLFTILPAPSIEGLQALHRRSNKWIRLKPPAGSIIINTGDYMQRITNDRFPSTTHRVAKPRDKSLFEKPRVSLPMAVYVWENEMLEVLPGCGPPKYEPISAIKFHTHSTSKFYGEAYAVDETDE